MRPAARAAPAGGKWSRRPDPWWTIRGDDTALLELPFTEFGPGTLLGVTQLLAEEPDLPPGAFTNATAPMAARFLLKNAFDCGTVVNPRLVHAQVEGGVTRALSTAPAERIRRAAGRVRERSLDDYPLLSLGAAPSIDVLLRESSGEAVGDAAQLVARRFLRNEPVSSVS